MANNKNVKIPADKRGQSGYLANVAKSIGYASFNKLKRMNPTISQFSETNAEVFKTIYKSAIDYRTTYRRGVDAFKKSKFYEAGAIGITALKDDIRTGNLYNIEREKEIETKNMEAMVGGDDYSIDDSGFDLGGMDDLDNWDDDFDYGDEDTNDYNQENLDKPSVGDAMVASSIEATSQANANAISMAVARSAEYQSEISIKNTNLLYTHNVRAFGQMNSHLDAMNSNIGSVMQYLDNNLTKHLENSTEFFSTVTPLLQDQVSLLREIAQNTKPKEDENKKKEEQNKKQKITYDSIVDGSGLPDFDEYIKKIGKNLEAFANEQTMGMGSMLSSLGGDTNILAQFAANPYGMLMDKMMDKLTPKAIEKGFLELNKSIGGLFGSAITRLNTMANDREGSMLTQAIGKIFGIKSARKSGIDTSNYEKGKVDWNGKSEKALTEIIPNKIDKIISLLSGKEETTYDYESGKYVTMDQLKTEYENFANSFWKSASSDIREAMGSLVQENLAFNSKKERDQLIEDIDKVFKQLYERNELLDINNKELSSKYFDYGVSSDNNMAAIQALAQALPKSMWHEFNNKMNSEYSNQKEAYERNEKSGKYNILFNNSGYNQFAKELKGEKNKKAIKTPFNSSELLDTKDDNGRNMFWYMQRMYAELHYIRKFSSGFGGGLSNNDIFLDGGPNGPQKIFDNSFDAEKARTLTVSSKKKTEKTDVTRKREAEQRANERFMKDQAKRMDRNRKQYEILANINDLDDPNQIRGAIGNVIDVNKNIKQVRATQEKGETLLDKVMAAKTLSEKTQTIVEKMDILSKKPVEIMERSLEKADEHLFNLIYGKQGFGKEKEVSGFLDAMLFQLNETFYKFNNFMEEKILDPLKDKLGLDQDKSLFKGLMEKFGITDKLNDFKDSAKERLSGITDAVKDSFKNMGRDIADTVKGTLSPLKDKFSRPNVFKPKKNENGEDEDEDDYDVDDYELTNIKNSYKKSSYKDVSNAEKRALRKRQLDAYNRSKDDQKRRKVLDKLDKRIDTLFNSYESGFDIIKDEKFNEELKSIRAKITSLKKDIDELEKDPNTPMSRLNSLYTRLNALEANLAKKEDEYVQFRIANPEIDEDIEAYNREKNRLVLARDSFKERHGLYTDEEVAGFKKDYEKDTFEYLRSKDFANLSDEQKQAYLDEISGGADKKKIRELEKEIEKNQKYLNNPSAKESNKKYYQSKIDSAQKEINLLQGNTYVDPSKLFKKLNSELKNYKKINRNGKFDSTIQSRERELQGLYDTFDMNYADKYTNQFIDTLSGTGNYSNDELGILRQALGKLYKNNVAYDEDSFKNLNLQTLLDTRTAMMVPLGARMTRLKTEMREKGHGKNSPTARNIKYLGGKINNIDSLYKKLNNDLTQTFGTKLRGKNLTVNDVIEMGGTSIKQDQEESEWYKYAKENGTQLVDKLDDETKNTSNIFTITQDILTELKSLTSVFKGGSRQSINTSGPRISPLTLANVNAANEKNTVRRRVNELTRNITGTINDFFRDIPGFDKGGHIDKDQLAVVGKGEYVMTPEQRKQISEALGGKIRSLKNSKNGILGKKDLNKDAKDVYSTIAGIMGKENVDPQLVMTLLSETGDAGQAFNELENVEESRAIVAMLKRVSHALSQRNEGKIDSSGNRTDVEPNSNIQDVFSETFQIYKRTIDRTMNSIMGEDPEKERTKAFKGMGTILKDAKVNKGDLIAGGLLGAGTSILTGFLGGPLLGAATGAAVALTTRSKSMQDMLFGEQEVDKDGNPIGRKGGILPANLVNKVGKVLPDLKKFGITGAAVGLLPLIPFGPVGGLIMGSGVAFAKNNALVQEKLFGESGILPKEKLDKFKDRLPNILAGAGIGLGAQILGFSTPFGLVGNLILGSGLGFASKTDKFQKMIFGEWDEDEGKYIGGVIPYLKNNLVDPMIGKVKDVGSKIFDWAKRDIFDPITSAIAPVTKQIQVMFQSVFGGIKNIIKGFVNDITTPIKQAIKEAFKYITSPFRKLGSMLTRGFGKLLSALPRAIGAGGRALRKHQIRRGTADYMTASERLQFMDDERDSKYYYQEARDRMKNSRRQLTADMKDRFGGRELANLQTWLTLGNYEEAEKVIKRNFGDTRDPESQAVMKNMIANLNEYKKYKDLHVTQKFGGATHGEKAKIGAIVRGEHEAAWKKYNEEHPENQVDYDTYMTMTQGEKFTENRKGYNLQSVDKFIAGASNDQLKNLQSHYEAINLSDKDYEKKKRVNGKKIRQLLKDLKLPWKKQRQITDLLDTGYYDKAMEIMQKYIDENGLSGKDYNKFDTLREEMKGFKETDKLRVDKDKTKAEFDRMLKEKFGDTTIFGRDISYEDFFNRIKGENRIRRLKGIDITDEDVKDDPVQQDVSEITKNVESITNNLEFASKQLEGIFKVLTGEYNSEEAKKARLAEKKRLDDSQFRREEKMFSDEKTRLKYLKMMGYNSLVDAPAEFKYMEVDKLKQIAETYTAMETNDPEKQEMADKYYGGNIPMFMRKTSMDQIRKAQDLYKRNPDVTKVTYQQQLPSSNIKTDSTIVVDPFKQQFADQYYDGNVPTFAKNMTKQQYEKAMKLYSRNPKTGEKLDKKDQVQSTLDDEGNEIRMKRDDKSGEMEADLSDSSTKKSIGIKKALREKQTQFYDKFLGLFKRDEKDDEKDEKKGGWLTKLLAALGIGKSLLGGAKNMLGGILGKGLLGGLFTRGILGTVGKGALVLGGLMYLPQIIDLFNTQIKPALSEAWQTSIKPWLENDAIPMLKEGAITLAKSLPGMIVGTAKFIITQLGPAILKGLGWDIGDDSSKTITYDENGNPVESGGGTDSALAVGANTATRYMVRKGSRYASKVSANVAESVAKKGGVSTVKESLTKEGAAKLAGKNITKTGIKDGLKNGLKTGLKTGKDFILHPIKTSVKGIVKGGKALGDVGGKQLGNMFIKMDGKRMLKNGATSAEKYTGKVLGNVADNSLVGKLLSFCKEKLIKLFSNKTVVNLLGKVKNVPIAKQLIEKFVPMFMEMLSKGAAKLSGTALARAVGGLSTGGILTAAFGVYDFVSGFNDARNIMGITEDDIPLGYRIAAGVVKCIQGVSIIATIIPTKSIMNALIKVLSAIGVDMGNIQEKQEEAKDEVEQYNQEHGTNYSIEEYNSEVKGYKSLFAKVGDGFKKTVEGVKWAGGKVVDFGSMIGQWFGNTFNKATKWIGDWYNDTLKPWFDKASKFLGNIFTWLGKWIINPLGTVGETIGNIVDWLSNKFDWIKNARDWTTNKYNEAKEGISNTWNNVKSSVVGAFTKKPSKNVSSNSVSSIKTVNGMSVGQGPGEENKIISEIKNSDLKSNVEDSVSDYASDKVKTNATKYSINGVNGDLGARRAEAKSIVSNYNKTNGTNYNASSYNSEALGRKGFFSSIASGISNGISKISSIFGRGEKDVNGVPYYSQKQFGDSKFGKLMSDSGCGPTATAMALSKVTGQNINPEVIAKDALHNGSWDSEGARGNMFSTEASKFGVKTVDAGGSFEKFDKLVSAGIPTTVSGTVGKGEDSPYTSAGHIVTVVGKDKNGNYLVNDPRGKEYSKAYTKEEMMNGFRNSWSFGKGDGDEVQTSNTVHDTKVVVNKAKSMKASDINSKLFTKSMTPMNTVINSIKDTGLVESAAKVLQEIFTKIFTNDTVVDLLGNASGSNYSAASTLLAQFVPQLIKKLKQNCETNSNITANLRYIIQNAGVNNLSFLITNFINGFNNPSKFVGKFDTYTTGMKVCAAIMSVINDRFVIDRILTGSDWAKLIEDYVMPVFGESDSDIKSIKSQAEKVIKNYTINASSTAAQKQALKGIAENTSGNKNGGNIFSSITNTLGNVANAVGSKVKSVASSVGKFVGNVGNAIGSAVGSAINWFGGLFGKGEYVGKGKKATDKEPVGDARSNIGGLNNFPYFSQHEDYSQKPSLSETGCGPTSAAMVLSKITGKAVMPDEIAEKSFDAGLYNDNGSNSALFPYIGNEYGVKVQAIDDFNKLKEYAKQGIPMVISGKGGQLYGNSKDGHIVASFGRGRNGYIVNDPSSPNSGMLNESQLRNGFQEAWVFGDQGYSQDIKDAEIVNKAYSSKDSYNEYDQALSNIYYGKGDPTTLTYVNGFPYWSQVAFGGDIMNAGCAPTATAMALTKITGKTISPKDTVALARKSGYWTANSGATSSKLIPYISDKYGVKATYIGSFSDASNYVSKGYPVIFDGQCKKSSQWSKNCLLTPYSGSGHYVTAFGRSGDDFVVNDPRGSKYSGKRTTSAMKQGFIKAFKIGDKTFTVDQSKVKTLGSSDGVENTGISGDGTTSTDGTTTESTATDFFTDMATAAANFTKKLFGFETTDISGGTVATGSGGTTRYTGTNYKVGESVKASFTSYYPANNAMEGGYTDSQGHPLNAAEQTCAAPKDVPIGTKIKISGTGTDLDGKIYTVTDRGGAIIIKNGVYRIDILVENKAACDKFKNCKGTITFMGKDDQQTQGTGDPIIDSLLYGKGESVDWGYFCDPSKGHITSYFGEKRSQYGNASGNHGALDYNIHNQPLYAPKSGTVYSENEHSSYGNSLTIQTNTPGMYYRLAHMSKKAVSKGDKVKQGQYLGVSGSSGHVTGPHVHVEILKGGTSKYKNGVDPLNYYGTKGKTITLKGSNLSFNDYIKNIGSIAEVNSGDTSGTTDDGTTTDGTTTTDTGSTGNTSGGFFSDMATAAANFTKKLFGFEIDDTISNSSEVDTSTSNDGSYTNSNGRTNADRILNFTKSKGASDAASAGVLGNAWCESRFDPTVNDKDYFGLFQWIHKYNQFNQLKKLASNMGVEWTDLDAQLNYMWSQLGDSTHKVWLKNQYKNGLDGFLSETDPYQAGTKFNKFFERGQGGPTRGKAAQNVFKYIKNGKLTDGFNDFMATDTNVGKGDVLYGKGDNKVSLSSKLIEYALSFLDKGFTYSQEHRDYINHDKNASDCSSFTHHVFDRAAGTEIGGYSEEQYTTSKGKKVNKSDLKPGDIILFKNTLSNRTGKTKYKDNVSHSSIYLGDSKFIESTTTQSGFKGIKVTDLNSNWSKQHYLTGKRFIDGDKKVDPTVKNPNKLTKFTKATGSYTLPDIGGTTGGSVSSVSTDGTTTETPTASGFFEDMATAAVNFSKKLFGFDITDTSSDSSSGSESTGLQSAASGDFLGKWGCSFETRGGGSEFDLGSNPGFADGYNYGIYQWNNKSDIPGFLKYLKGADSKFAKIFTGSTATNSQWQSAYSQYPEDFIKHQVIYEGKNWYGWQKKQIDKLGLNVDSNRAYQEIAVDTANAANVNKVWKPAVSSGAKGKDLIGKVMDYQSSYMQKQFGYSATSCNNRWGSNSKERQKLYSIYDANTPAIDYTYSSAGKGEGDEFNIDKYFEDTLGAVKTSDFGIRDDEFHSGVDYATQEGNPIASPVEGKVVENTKDDKFGFGNTLVIRDKNNKDHRFAHMQDRSSYGLGSKVRKNSIIGNVGNTGNSTGSHLHYEVSDSKGVSINPKDYMGKGGSTNKLDKVTLSFPDSNQKVNANVDMGKGNGVSEDTLVRLINLVIQLLTKISDNTNDISTLVDLIKTIQSGKSNSKSVNKYSTDTSKTKTQKLLNTLQKGLNSKDTDSTNLEYILSTLETIASE